MDKPDGLDSVTYQGNVLLREWLDDRLHVFHTMTPAKSRELAAQLNRSADVAEAQMPSLLRVGTDTAPGSADHHNS